jgi:8-oxo-dGTP pyrophosphatase MutT (NUDIX family)
VTYRVQLKEIVIQVSRDGRERSGTGFYITRNLILTCYHVLGEAETNEPLRDKYWIQHDRWKTWQQAEPVPAYCHRERDTAVLRCSSYPMDVTAELRFADWDNQVFQFTSRGYDADTREWGVGATTIEGTVDDSTYLKGHPRLRLRTEPGTVVQGRSGSPVWSQRQDAIVGIVDWVGQELSPGGGDEVLAIPIAEALAVANDAQSIAELAAIERQINEPYRERTNSFVKVAEEDIDQVAAVCYQRVGESVQLLLVKSDGGRWIFPKGGIKKGEQPWMAAEREALEEAGVTGVVRQEPLTKFLHHKRGKKLRGQELVVQAHLLCVQSQQDPEEEGREPTWCTPEVAEARLSEKREPAYGLALRRVVREACQELQ